MYISYKRDMRIYHTAGIGQLLFDVTVLHIIPSRELQNDYILVLPFVEADFIVQINNLYSFA